MEVFGGRGGRGGGWARRVSYLFYGRLKIHSADAERAVSAGQGVTFTTTSFQHYQSSASIIKLSQQMPAEHPSTADDTGETMHNFWNIPELARLVVDHLEQFEQARMARLSTSLWPIATSCLWARLLDIRPLLALLGVRNWKVLCEDWEVRPFRFTCNVRV